MGGYTSRAGSSVGGFGGCAALARRRFGPTWSTTRPSAFSLGRPRGLAGTTLDGNALDHRDWTPAGFRAVIDVARAALSG